MGLFDSKTDQSQNTQLAQVIKNLDAVIKNQNWLIAQVQAHAKWIAYLNGQDERGVTKDKEIDAALSGLKQLGASISQAEKETEK